MNNKFFKIVKVIFAIITIVIVVPTASAWNFRKGAEYVTEANPMPEFPGGQEAFEKLINERCVFPSDPKERKHYEDAVIEIQIKVLTDGSIEDPDMCNVFLRTMGIKEPGGLRDVLKELPPFKPGEVDGKPVNVRFLMPVTLHPPKEE